MIQYKIRNERKGYLKKRWLYFVSLIFSYIVPLVIVFEACFKVEKVDKKVSIQLAGFILGCIYLAVLSKKTKKRVENLPHGSLKIILDGLVGVIPYATAGLLVYLVERLFKGFDTSIIMIIISMLAGTALKALEFAFNRTYLYNLEIYKEAKRKVDIERKIEELKNNV